MSLKVEQLLDNFFFTTGEPRIYTTGAYLVPLELKKGNESRYVWVMYDYKDDTFRSDGKDFSPRVYGRSVTELMNYPQEE